MTKRILYQTTLLKGGPHNSAESCVIINTDKNAHEKEVLTKMADGFIFNRWQRTDSDLKLTITDNNILDVEFIDGSE